MADSAVKFKHLVQSIHDFAISILGLEGQIISWNAGAERFIGYKDEEIIGKNFRLFYPPEETAAHKPEDMLRQAKALGRSEDHAWHVRKDGSRFWASVILNAIYDEQGQLTGFAKITRDMTAWKLSEEKLRAVEEQLAEQGRRDKEALEERVTERTEQLSNANTALQVTVSELKDSREQLRQLSKRFHSLQEKERSRIAHEVHDELGQMLAVIKIELLRMKKRAGEHTEIALQAKSLMDTVDQTIVTLRRISSDLRPVVLEQLGIEAALDWLAADIAKRTGVICKLTVESELGLVGSEVATGLFRITQEAMTNALKHSGTERIDIQVQQIQNNLCLTIRDYGRGIREEDKIRSSSLGLIGMRERTLAIGGSLSVQPEPTGGTMVVVEVPMNWGANP